MLNAAHTMAGVGRTTREGASFQSSASESSMAQDGTTESSSKTSASTRPTSVSSVDAPLNPRKRTSTSKATGAHRTRVSGGVKAQDSFHDGQPNMPSKAATLLGFGFTKNQRAADQQPALSIHVADENIPNQSSRQTSSSQQTSSFLDEASDDESRRHISSSSQAPLLGRGNTIKTVPPSSVRKRGASEISDSAGRLTVPLPSSAENSSSGAPKDPRRDLSGETLVDNEESLQTKRSNDEDHKEKQSPGGQEDAASLDLVENQEIAADADTAGKSKPSFMGKLKGKMASITSNLGKRKRDVKEAVSRGKDRIQRQGGRKSTRIPTLETKQEEETIEDEEPSSKKIKMTATPARASAGGKSTVSASHPVKIKTTKTWLDQGQYSGQDRHFNVHQKPGQRAKAKKEQQDIAIPAENKSLPLPMWYAAELLDLDRKPEDHAKRRDAMGWRDFKLPFDVYSPKPQTRKGAAKPASYTTTRTNRVTDGAKAEVNRWRAHNKLPASHCNCSSVTGCDDDCLNRTMFYECDDKNCRLKPEECGNRAFAELRDRTESEKTQKKQIGDGTTQPPKKDRSCKLYNIGVEVVATDGKGFGVRASRSFNPGQIIMEYAGEIITSDEAEDRMVNQYKDAENYYLMTFHSNLIIDATCGTMARFINHSCEPNCQMVKWNVSGRPRMALFAGDTEIGVGDELTYDYNFNNFNAMNTTLCACGTESCRGILGPKPTEQQIKKEKNVKEQEKLKKQREIAEQAQAQLKKKKPKRHVGWVYLDKEGNKIDPSLIEEAEEDEEEEEEERPSKRAKLTTTVTDKGKPGKEGTGRKRTVLSRKNKAR